jgi:hypothetical protein
MLNAITRALIRLRLRMIAIETAQAEAAERDIPRRLEELAQEESALRTKLTALHPTIRLVPIEAE